MNDVALQIVWFVGVNAAVASVLVVGGSLAQRRGHDRLAHALCLLALLKLLTPPLVHLPVLPALSSSTQPATELSSLALAVTPPANPAWPVDAPRAVAAPAAAPAWPLLLLSAALLGSGWLAGRTIVRSVRFRRYLRGAAKAPLALSARARAIAQRMQLAPCPEVLVLSARISPMLCVVGGRAHILLPAALVDAMPLAQVDTLLAHELAHAHRRDHWVRAIEIAATCLYWWLPTTWWARRTLRVAEERCCDARVLHALPGQGRAYADALLATLDFLAGATRAMPPVACGASAFHDMKTRLTTIMTPRPTRPLSWTLRLALCAGAAALLPIAPSVAQEDAARGDADARRELRAAMEELSKLRAELDALRANLESERPESRRPESRGPESGTPESRSPATSEHHDRLADILEKARAATADSVREKVHKAMAAVREHAAQFDAGDVHEQLAKVGETVDKAVHEHLHEHVHRAVEEAMAQAKNVDPDQLGRHIEKAVRTATTAARRAAAGATGRVHEALAQAHEKLMQAHGEDGHAAGHEALHALTQALERTRAKPTEDARAALEAAEKALARVGDGEGDGARARRQARELERRAEQARAESEEMRTHREAFLERVRAGQTRAAGADQHAAELEALRADVRRLQARIEAMTQEAKGGGK